MLTFTHEARRYTWGFGTWEHLAGRGKQMFITKMSNCCSSPKDLLRDLIRTGSFFSACHPNMKAGRDVCSRKNQILQPTENEFVVKATRISCRFNCFKKSCFWHQVLFLLLLLLLALPFPKDRKYSERLSCLYPFVWQCLLLNLGCVPTKHSPFPDK